MAALFQLRYLPNLLTGLRLVLIPLLLWLVWTGADLWALLLFLFAGASDALDGFLAKHYGWTTELGGRLDPIADKSLLVGLFVVLLLLGELPLWLVVLAIGRDMMILLGALAYHYLIEPLQAEPLLVSKLNTLMQLMLILAILTDRALLTLPTLLIDGLIGLTAMTLVWSGLSYLHIWSSRARHYRRQSHVK